MYVLIIHEIHIIYGKKSFLVLCDSYPGRDLAGRDVGTVVNMHWKPLSLMKGFSAWVFPKIQN